MIHYSGHLMKFDSVTYGNFKLTCLSVSHIFRLENERTYIYIKMFAKFLLIRIACCAYKLIVFVSNTYSLNRQINYGFLKKKIDTRIRHISGKHFRVGLDLSSLRFKILLLSDPFILAFKQKKKF